MMLFQTDPRLVSAVRFRRWGVRRGLRPQVLLGSRPGPPRRPAATYEEMERIAS